MSENIRTRTRSSGTNNSSESKSPMKRKNNENISNLKKPKIMNLPSLLDDLIESETASLDSGLRADHLSPNSLPTNSTIIITKQLTKNNLFCVTIFSF
jgi:hypothetical protein